jgi:chemotaxis protein CheD
MERNDPSKSKLIEVGMAQVAVAPAPAQLICYSLGSCVALVLYDRRARVGGMAHVMLPESNSSPCAMPGKYANRAPEALIAAMAKLGANPRRITARLVGGASLFNIQDGNEPSMGERNTRALKECLAEARLRLVAEDTGGNVARTVIFCADKGTLRVRTAARGEYEV